MGGRGEVDRGRQRERTIGVRLERGGMVRGRELVRGKGDDATIGTRAMDRM